MPAAKPSQAAIKDALRKLLDCMNAVDDEAERADQPGAGAWSSAPVIAMSYAREEATRAIAEQEGNDTRILSQLNRPR